MGGRRLDCAYPRDRSYGRGAIDARRAHLKLFVLGGAASGKTTLAAALRAAAPALAVWDTDDEILRLNGGTWPSIEEKNARLLPAVVEAATREHELVLLNTYMPLNLARVLAGAGFTILLVDVSEQELRRRHRQRAAAEGWSNEEGLEWEQSAIAELRNRGLIDRVVSGEQPTEAIARRILELRAER